MHRPKAAGSHWSILESSSLMVPFAGRHSPVKTRAREVLPTPICPIPFLGRGPSPA